MLNLYVPRRPRPAPWPRPIRVPAGDAGQGYPSRHRRCHRSGDAGRDPGLGRPDPGPHRASPEPESFASKYFGPENAAKRFDPARAKALIAEAGYAPGQGRRPKVYLDSPTFQFGQEKEVAEAISVMLQDVGFDVQLTVLDNNAFQQQINQAGNNREIMLSTLGTLPSLVPTFYSCEWKQANYTLCDQEWTALNRQILSTGDPAARLALWEKFWDFYFDWSQTISLYEIDNAMAMNSKFKWTPRADGWMTFRDLTVAR